MESEGLQIQELSDDRQASGGDEQDSSQATSAKKFTMKKRTKTGCLTCRRRRIKCDETKPRCNNCIKSKRQCDGYNQRVIFKDPMGCQTNHMDPIVFQNATSHGMMMNPHMPGPARHMTHPSQTALPFIAPRPPMMPDMLSAGPSHSFQHHMHHQHPHASHGFSLHPEQIYQHGLHPNQMPIIPPSQHNPALDPSTYPSSWQQQQPLSNVAPVDSYILQDFVPPGSYGGAQVALDGSVTHPPIDLGHWPGGETFSISNTVPVSEQYAQQLAGESMEPLEPLATSMFDDGNYWYTDDDASMAASGDDEEESDDDAQHLESNDLGVIVARRLQNYSADAFGTQMRTFSKFVDADVLATYVPSSANSPLNDAQTASVFWYFVNVTGPSMSLFERRPFDTTPIFKGQPVPRSCQHIWTYTFPIIALNHPALLQAMLALGSLQMARLQGAPHTASMKHYHLSLRRIARNCGSPSRRVQPATLAATMLLGFYEVWTSDHDKWCKHLWGARAIMREIPIKDMTRKIIALKREQRMNLQAYSSEFGNGPFANTLVAERDIDQVDSSLVERLSGQPVGYEDDKSNTTASASASVFQAWTASNHYTEKDIETYELIADLFWWYCKMDVYQSILGGTPLIMEYSCWTQCTPRAPIGKIDAIYGTYDHLMLLLGRVCDFSNRDQSRKRKIKRPEPPGGAQGQSPPAFAGMIPSTGQIIIPKGFSPPREVSPQSENHDDIDLEASTAAAVIEWENIRVLFDEFRSQLGPDFEPLGPEFEFPVSSPFGPALKYRTYGIAGVWMNYYMGLIALYRCHPSMPPIAMAAAGMAARQTAPFAIQAGRIVAGIGSEDMSTMSSLSTMLGCVSIECCFPLFVAAVQYQDDAQRTWTVRRLHNVARLTGWQSARQIATGCETGWIKAAELGRGPHYELLPDLDEPPPSIWNRPRRIVDRIRELEEVEERLVLSSSERPHYAIGLLSVETDLERLELSDRD